MPSEPKDLGYAPPSMTATVSPAASYARAAAITANPSAYMLPVKPRTVLDQREVQCCVSCALGIAMELANPSRPQLAPLFHYYVTRHGGGADSGGLLRLNSAIRTLISKGICRYTLHPMPYTPVEAEKPPSPEAYEDGHKHRILPQDGYRKCLSTSRVAWIRDMLLRKSSPVVLGLRLPRGYPDSFLNPKFEWRDPEDSELSSSRHCVLVLGYDDIRQALRIQDSRGNGRFEHGCWWMGYRVIDSQVVEEAICLFSVRKQEGL
jgi:hypothetical protein